MTLKNGQIEEVEIKWQWMLSCTCLEKVGLIGGVLWGCMMFKQF